MLTPENLQVIPNELRPVFEKLLSDLDLIGTVSGHGKIILHVLNGEVDRCEVLISSRFE